MSNVGVLIEHSAGEVRQPALELLTVARDIGTPVAIWLGEAPSDAQLAVLGDFGATEVRVVAIGEDVHYASKAAKAVEAAMSNDVHVLLVQSTFGNKELATRLAIATGAGMVVDASSAKILDDAVETDQTVFTATWNVHTRIDTARSIVALRPNTTQAVAVGGAAPSVVDVEVELPEAAETIVKRELVEAQSGPALAEARVVVSGGRGTGGDYALVQELADLLGGAVGASRDATDEGWISHEHMVGQTGTTVTPALYIACGISGAVHHRGGMQASGLIVAINTDRDAPMFEIADFGVVGDIFEVLPATIAELKARR